MTQPAAQPEILPMRVPTALPSSAHAVRRPTVLVVDDEPCIRRFLRCLLEKSGYHVFEACQGSEGLAIVRSVRIDLVITDLFMDVHNGLETIQDLHRDHPSVKIIAMSGAVNDNYLRIARVLGADQFVAKPFSSEHLLQTIVQLV